MVAPNPTATSLGWIRSISCEALRMAWRKSVECEMIRPSVPSSARFKMDLWRNRSYGYLPSKHWSWVYRKQKSMLIRIWMEKCFDAKKDEFRDFQIRWKRCWPQVEGTTVSWKKRLWSLIFALQFISLNLTQPPPPQSFLVDLKTIHPMDCMEIWPKKHKNQNKTPKTIAPNHQKCHKKNGYIAVLAPLSSQVFFFEKLLLFWLSGALTAETFSGQLPERRLVNFELVVRQHPPIPWKKRTRLSGQHLCKRFQETTHERT